MSSLLSSLLSYSHLREAYRSCEMARFNWRYCLLSFSSIVAGQSSTSQPADGLTTAAGSATATVGTATINGTPTTYSVAFTVPAAADVGPNILPNVKDPSAKQAQQLCPGYTASNVQRTKYGFSASLSLAGDAVRRSCEASSNYY
jgi:alpha-glucosidase